MARARKVAKPKVAAKKVTPPKPLKLPQALIKNPSVMEEVLNAPEATNNRPAWPWLVLMMAAAVAFSITFLLGQSLRLDEAQSLFQVAHTPSKLLQLVAEDVHVPLYHFMLHFWTIAFGNAVATARILSLIFFVATIPIVYQLGKENFSRRIGLTAAFLLTISPFMNWYGSEARMYTLLTLMTVINQLFFLRAMRRGESRDWFWYTISAMIGAYSHYFFLLVLLTQAIFYLSHRSSFKKGSFWHLLLAAVGVGAALAPWLWYVAKLGFASGTKPLLARPTTVDLFNTFSQFFFGFQTNRINTIIVSLWPLLVLGAFLTLQRRRKINSTASFWIFASILPVIFAFAFSLLVQPFFISRYLIVSLPALYLFVAWVISNYTATLRVAISLLLAVTMAGTLAIEAGSPNTPVKENYLGATTYINEHAQPQDVVLISAPFTIYPIEYYYNAPASIDTIPTWDRFKSGSPDPFSAKTLPTEVKTDTADKQYAWVILSYDQGYESTVRNYFLNHYQLMYRHQFSNDLTLYKFKINYNAPVPLTTTPVTADNQ